MTRKKKPLPQKKRQQVVDASGWTHVIKAPNNKVGDQHSILVSQQRPSSSNTSFTLETYLDKFHNHYIPRWWESSCFKNLKRIFEQGVLLAEQTKITNCVCLGLGSMTAGFETPSFELAALMSMLEMLSKFHSTGGANCYLRFVTSPRQETHHRRSHLPRPNLQPPRPRRPCQLWLHRPR
jgi:hypothetical protein